MDAALKSSRWLLWSQAVTYMNNTDFSGNKFKLTSQEKLSRLVNCKVKVVPFETLTLKVNRLSFQFCTLCHTCHILQVVNKFFLSESTQPPATTCQLVGIYTLPRRPSPVFAWLSKAFTFQNCRHKWTGTWWTNISLMTFSFHCCDC